MAKRKDELPPLLKKIKERHEQAPNLPFMQTQYISGSNG